MCERIDWDRCLEQGDPPFRADLGPMRRRVDGEIRRNSLLYGVGVAVSVALVYALLFLPYGASAGVGWPAVVIGGVFFGMCCFVYFGARLGRVFICCSDARVFRRSLCPLEDNLYGEVDKWCGQHEGIRSYRNAAMERGGVITMGEFWAMRNVIQGLQWECKRPNCGFPDQA